MLTLQVTTRRFAAKRNYGNTCSTGTTGEACLSLSFLPEEGLTGWWSKYKYWIIPTSCKCLSNRWQFWSGPYHEFFNSRPISLFTNKCTILIQQNHKIEIPKCFDKHVSSSRSMTSYTVFRQDGQCMYNATLRHTSVRAWALARGCVHVHECMQSCLSTMQRLCVILRRHLCSPWLHHIFQHSVTNGTIFEKKNYST